MPAAWFMAGLVGLVVGIRGLTAGLERLGGRTVRQSLGRFGRDPVAAWLAGALAAALLHSSGLVTVAVVGLVQARVIGFPAAIGAVLGANVGTTATAQLMGFSTIHLGSLCVAGGAVAHLMGGWVRARRARWLRPAGGALLGLGLAFLGLEALGASLGDGAAGELARWLGDFAERPVPGVLAGTLFTSLIQSSTLFVGVVMKLAGEGLVTLTGAIHLVLGSNVGSCVPGLIAGVIAGRAGWWTGLINLVFNVAGVAAALPLAPALAELVSWTAGSVPRQVANAHGLFNLVTALAALPLAGPVGRWLERGMDAPAAKPGRVRGGAIWWRRG